MVDEKTIAEYNATRDINARAVACYVPFSHMFFSFGGVVHNCCFSGKLSYLGKWPDKSIRDIWFGDSFNQLRKAMRRNDFSLGCATCEQRIIVKDFESVGAKSYDHYSYTTNLTGTVFPQVMEFELDNICNLECVMCDGRFSSSIRRNREKMEPFVPAYNPEFVKQLEEFIPHLRKALFYGGEPFMTHIYFDIWEKMIDLNPEIEIRVHTNGMFLNQKIKNILAEGRFHINVSMDATEKELFERVRSNSNFERVMENAEYFISYCRSKKTDFTISPSPLATTWKEIPKLLRWANERQVYIVYNIVTYPKNLSLRSLTSAELRNISETLAIESITCSNSLEETNFSHYKNYLSHIQHLFFQAQEQEQHKNDTSVTEEVAPFLEKMNQYVHTQFEPGEWAGAEEIIYLHVKGFLEEAKFKGIYSTAVNVLSGTAPEMIIQKFPHRVNLDVVRSRLMDV